jgi:hypothetical protein
VTRYEWAPSASKHRVSRARAQHVLETVPVAYPLPGAEGEPDPALLLFVGDDPGGVPLEVVVRLLDDGTVHAIHVMKLRPKYRPLYESTR